MNELIATIFKLAEHERSHVEFRVTGATLQVEIWDDDGDGGFVHEFTTTEIKQAKIDVVTAFFNRLVKGMESANAN